MINKYIILGVVLVTYLIPTSSFATSDTLKNNDGYKESVDLIKKMGRQGVIKFIVKVQRDHVKEYGSSLDEYTTVIGIIGNQFGFVQTTQFNIDSMLDDVNKQRVKVDKKTVDKNKLISSFKEGGNYYNSQVNMVCSTPSTRALIDYDIEYTYKNFDKNMGLIGLVRVDKAKCIEIE